jgi:epoxide hydrolase
VWARRYVGAAFPSVSDYRPRRDVLHRTEPGLAMSARDALVGPLRRPPEVPGRCPRDPSRAKGMMRRDVPADGDDLIPFRIEVPERELEDLRSRLRATRWPEPEPVGDWSQGVPLAWLRGLCEHWAEGYDWRVTEARLNALPQFRTTVDGLAIHLLHVRSPVDDALPLVMTHGWPGSVVEYLDVLGPLADPGAHGGDPADAFHVVCPSLPGYGFSDKPAEAGWGVERIAAAWAELMARLGYDRYGAHGSDWGTSVSAALGRHAPEHLAGLHLVPPLVGPDPATMDDLTDREREALADLERAGEWESG